ncbi:hypothetical protein N7367_03195 [Stenotrophomonas sp. GD04145]|uniref:hypothetical protein n=1 Tax=Stenotrophomonas sp. GD04145 TaxID=2975436 RepID=UPI002448932E|nr:hypothetical protein [Stenotrophomonas sp. GD04145]MDH0170462.1 hypothetical protein [Stenotrophomonas sp. GD04145]
MKDRSLVEVGCPRISYKWLNGKENFPGLLLRGNTSNDTQSHVGTMMGWCAVVLEEDGMLWKLLVVVTLGPL